jgi:patatin-like phospholipase/acyl hydrolase
MTFVKLEAALQSFIKDHGNEKLFLVDKYNDLAMAAYKLKNTPYFASKALKYTEKACELFKKRHTGDIPTPYYHNLVLCHKTCNERSSAEHYMKYLHGQSIDKIIQWKQVPRVQRPVIVLCMDGGGMRGLALIKMIDCISEALGMKLDRTKLDMICGTSTGGLLALGLGVKNMSTIQGRDLYYHIGANVFAYKFGDHTKKLFRSLKEGGRFDTNALQKVITDNLGSEILLKTEQERKQKKEPLVFVSAVISGKQPTSLLLRNYHSKRARDSTCKIYEAARATSAAPFFFSSQPISFVDKTKYEMVDGGVMKNNPTWSAYHEEALDQFGDTRDYIVISLGTGRISPTKAEELIENSNKSGFIPLTSVAMLIQIATDSEEVHRQMETHAKMDPKLSYFRFNPTDLPVEKLHESKKQRLIDMEASTEMYMRTTEVKKQLENLKALFDLVN